MEENRMEENEILPEKVYPSEHANMPLADRCRDMEKRIQKLEAAKYWQKYNTEENRKELKRVNFRLGNFRQYSYSDERLLHKIKKFLADNSPLARYDRSSTSSWR